ncbi:MAG TPA: bifunctional phosphopantothenoylcysteine decarboxylase/phosphopantothenate--cysteine ligase CoaBC, partial [Thermoleophilia bacterium]|nr:bifunctional phosphopantothenoylcysteine decarboxylase/phosphopantothenate--cysteine ligase CoaBC [Thermoleophilia bacterium]
TAVYLAFRGPVIVAPSANWAMYEHPATQDNLRLLAERGVEVLPTGVGALACGETGSGRMVEPEEILAAVKRAFATGAGGALAGRKVVVTAGGTREPLDAVRFIGNRSSGKMGRAVADDAYLRGAEVVLIDAAVGGREVPYRRVTVETSDDMASAVATEAADAEVLVMAAAVADFKPERPQTGEKIGRADRARLTLELVPTVDILAASERAGLVRVGFVAEAGPRLDRARAKKAAKGVDLLVFNDILAAGVGIGSDENEITMLTPKEEIHVARSPKEECARAVLDQVEALLAGRARPTSPDKEKAP